MSKAPCLLMSTYRLMSSPDLSWRTDNEWRDEHIMYAVHVTGTCMLQAGGFLSCKIIVENKVNTRTGKTNAKAKLILHVRA